MRSVVVIFHYRSGIFKRVFTEVVAKCNPCTLANEVVQHLAVCSYVIFVGHEKMWVGMVVVA